MYFLYAIVYTFGFVVLLPKFVFDAIFNGKYAAGFKQRFGFLPKFDPKGRRVAWLHCVSVGEANAARELARRIKETYPEHSLVVSTTTKTGQKLVKETYKDIADFVFYFPFDWRFTVRRALRHIKPKVVLMMETEIWFNFYREAYKSGARVCIVNGRLSEKSLGRYGKIKKFMKRILGYVQLALMQDKADATRIMSLGIRGSKVKVTGNLKFDQGVDEGEAPLTKELRDRFGITPDAPLIIAASTHAPEEKWVLEAFKTVSNTSPARLMIAPRHPQRFGEVARFIENSVSQWSKRSNRPSTGDKTADVILLDSIGELRSAYPLAEIVFVGGSLIRHGGQSIMEPAAAGRAVITGPHTTNFAAAMKEFRDSDAIVQIGEVSEQDVAERLAAEFRSLLADPTRRQRLASNALAVVGDNRGAVERSLEFLAPVFQQGVRSRD